MAQCPAHEDRSPSLSVTRAQDGKVLVNCFAGCQTEDVLQSLGLDWPDLWENMEFDPCREDYVTPKRRHLSEDAKEALRRISAVLAK